MWWPITVGDIELSVEWGFQARIVRSEEAEMTVKGNEWGLIFNIDRAETSRDGRAHGSG